MHDGDAQLTHNGRDLAHGIVRQHAGGVAMILDHARHKRAIRQADLSDRECRPAAIPGIERNDFGGLHSIFAPANSTTFFHLSVSDCTTAPKPSGVTMIGMPPSSATRCFIAGSARISLTSLLSLSTISSGVPFGAPMPNHALASKPFTVSPTVGTSASSGARSAVVTASARNPPDLAC